jgi:hypothetical protein
MTRAHAEVGKRIKSVMENKTLKFQSDKFRKSRGGHSRWLLISCTKCKARLFLYQKDGPGVLKRLYLDRIIGQAKTSCDKCKIVVGVRTLHRKENRPVIRLFVGAIEKQVISSDKTRKFVRANQ